MCEQDPYFQYFTGQEFFQHAFPHERSNLSHWRKRLGEKLELLLGREPAGGAQISVALVPCVSAHPPS
jgi:hypothetical protein